MHMKKLTIFVTGLPLKPVVMFSQEILKGTIKPIIIKLISDNGRMYGYQITQRVRELTAGSITLTEGALYPALHKLVADGVLNVETEWTGNRERKYYSLSKGGAKAAAAKLEEVGESIGVLAELFGLRPPACGGR